MRGSNRRRYFTEAELGKLISAARKGRWGQRDATLILCDCAGARLNLFRTKRPQIGWTLLGCWSRDDQHGCSPWGLAP
jgi:hypothetical protein